MSCRSHLLSLGLGRSLYWMGMLFALALPPTSWKFCLDVTSLAALAYAQDLESVNRGQVAARSSGTNGLRNAARDSRKSRSQRKRRKGKGPRKSAKSSGNALNRPPVLSGTIGHFGLHSIRPSHYLNNRFSILLAAQQDLFENSRLTSEFLAIADTKRTLPSGEKADVFVRSLAIAYGSGLYKVTVGMQVVNWSEALGLSPADIVNPRDFTEPWFTDTPLQRIPLGMLNVQVFPDPFALQFIYVPLPRRTPLLGIDLGVPLAEPADYRAFADFEGGLRLGYFFSGWEVRGLFYRHHNRVPVFSVAEDVFPPQVRLNERKVSTSGAQFNNGGESVVTRGEVVVTLGVPVQNPSGLKPETHNVVQSAVGIDYTTENSFTLTLQHNLNWYTKKPEAMTRQTVNWLALRSLFPTVSVAQGKLQSELLTMLGVGHKSSWVKGKLVWSPTGSIRWNLEAHYFGDSDPESALIFRPGKFLVSDIAWQF